MRIFRSSAIALALAASTLWPTIAQSRDTSGLGPAPRTEDGRFDNWVGVLSHGGRGIRLPFFLRRIRASFSGRPGAPARVPNDGAFLRENAMHSTPTVTWVGHATVLVQMDHITFLTDPTWSDTASPVSFFGPRRYVEPGIAMEDLPPIDFVVISHNHYDHLDLGTLEALASRDPKTRFFVPLENEHLLRSRGIENVEALDWGTFAEHEGVRVYCLPAQHWSKRGPNDDLETLWSSWAVVGPERRFYFAGDTGYFDGFKKIARALGPFDLAALPIGAYEPVEMMKASHMNPEEAVQAALDLGARRTLAVHFGTFELADEALDDPPIRFRRAAESRLAEDTGWIFRIGETREW